ncbi:hypothetical protein P3102_26720 [Amycolatopsis sp. QT-25]|uniref:hypothetical protein n=1 Tax=Amycolatopsis sp. QT-25 TaxID=3034022 RepID=UPI0023EDFCBB|nr:hypothetical protein [Amycolatopsis sp. QT-25]WET77652.1 hypothetical protein P3102_26720 [Amycolatopsis sp. QT-25]
MTTSSFPPRILVALVPVTGALFTRPAERVLGTITYGMFMAFGLVAALGQVHIATAVTGRCSPPSAVA